MDMGSQIRVIQVEAPEQPTIEKPDWSFLKEEDRSEVPRSLLEETASLD